MVQSHEIRNRHGLRGGASEVLRDVLRDVLREFLLGKAGNVGIFIPMDPAVA